MTHSCDPPSTRTLSPETVALAARGDRGAMQKVLERNHDFVRRMMYRLVGSDPELDDLVQTVLMRIVTSLATARLDCALTTWIGGICVHVARDHLRRRKVRSIVVASDACNDMVAQHPDTADVHRSAVARQRLSLCSRALDELSDEQHTAFVLRVFEGYAVKEVASMMGAAHSTTRLRLYFARKKFCSAMAKLEGEEAHGAQELEEG